jgi:hypothetical protein
MGTGIKKPRGRGLSAVKWIEKYCLVPSGPNKGDPVALTAEERHVIHHCYDDPNGLQYTSDIGQPLAAYLVLLHICGIEAVKHSTAPPQLHTDIFTLWGAAGPVLREYLKRQGESVTCPALDTRWPTAA